MPVSLTDEPRTTNAAPTVYIVDDDPLLCRDLQQCFEAIGLRAERYGSAAEFLRVFDDGKLGCLILGVRLPGFSGIDLQERLKTQSATIPVIMLTPYDDVALAVRAMKMGAVDVFQKPPGEYALSEAVWGALDLHRKALRQRAQQEHTRKRLERLSARQQDILTLIVAGRSTKEIAAELGLSPKTIEHHRTCMMKRMEVIGVVDLVRVVCHSNSFFGMNADGWNQGSSALASGRSQPLVCVRQPKHALLRNAAMAAVR